MTLCRHTVIIFYLYYYKIRTTTARNRNRTALAATVINRHIPIRDGTGPEAYGC